MERNNNNTVLKIDVKQSKKEAKEHKIARHRGFKNFLIFFAGFFTSLVLVFGILFVVFKFVPIKSVVKDTDGVVSEEVAESSILDLLLNYDKYSLGDFPVVVDALKSAIDSTGANDFVDIDYEKLKTLSFSGDGNLKDQIMDCVTVTATLSSVVENDSELGALNNLSVITTAEEVVPDTSASDFNPKLYYYKVGNVYKRAFTDAKVLVDGAIGKTLYLPPIKEVPVGDLMQIFTDLFNRTKAKELVSVFAGELSADNIIFKVLGETRLFELDGFQLNITIKDAGLENELGAFSDLDMFKYAEEVSPDTTASDFNSKLYYYKDGEVYKRAYTDENVLVNGAIGQTLYLPPINEVPLAELAAILGDRFGMAKVKDVIGAFSSEVNSNSMLLKIIGDKKISEMNTISEYTIMLKDVLGEYEGNKEIYDILIDITNKNVDNLYLSDLQNINTNDIKLTTVLGEYGDSNKALYDILMNAFNIESKDDLSQITINKLKGLNQQAINNIKLTTILGEYSDSNKALYDILMNAFNIESKDDLGQITIGKLNGLNQDDINDIKLTTILGEYSDSNKVLYDILMNAFNIESKDDLGQITIGKLKGLNQEAIDKIKLTTILGEYSENQKLYDVLLNIQGIKNPTSTDADRITIGSLSDFDYNELSLTVIIPYSEDKNNGNKKLYDILKDVTGETDIKNITVGSLNSINSEKINDIKLISIIDYASNKTLYKILLDAANITYTDANIEEKINNLNIRNLTIFNTTNIKLANVITGEGAKINDMFDVIVQATGVSKDEITVEDLSLFDVSRIHLEKIITGEDEKTQNLFEIILEATGKTKSEVTVENLSLFDVSKVKLHRLLAYDSSNEKVVKLYEIIKEATGEGKDSVSVGNLSNFDINSIHLASLIGTETGNNVLDAILRKNPTLNELTSVVNDLEMSDVFVTSSECFTTDKTGIISTARYRKVGDNYILKQQEDADYNEQSYYIKKNIMLFLLYDFDEIDSSGNAKEYTKKSVKFVNFEASQISANIKLATIRQLIDLGLLEDKATFASLSAYTMTLNDFIETLL